ncbi:MAG: alpha-L-rhamnosidase [Verrucomicrobia bacterium]|nr:alpha-L-rhamnosidase [Verrucomicrobiota bacterium]
MKASFRVRRIVDSLTAGGSPEEKAGAKNARIDVLPSAWINVPGVTEETSSVSVYRLRFTVESRYTFRICVTADQRYWLYLDGERIGMGSERGCPGKWFYEVYEIELGRGGHFLGALTWYLAEKAPWGQMTVRPGFMLGTPDSTYAARINTGLASWQARVIPGVSFMDQSERVGPLVGTGARVCCEGIAWNHVFDPSAEWAGAEMDASGHDRLLHPAVLPAMRYERIDNVRVALVDKAPSGTCISMDNNMGEEASAWQAMLKEKGADVVVPPHSHRRILIALGNYVCAYSRLVTSGGRGAEIRVGWAERLSVEPDRSTGGDDRLGFDGMYFVGLYDTFKPSGMEQELLEPLWWLSGCWVQIEVWTATEPVAIQDLSLFETGYPLDCDYALKMDNRSLEIISGICLRTQICCSHETYMDPYYEQLQYVGDTRLQGLITYATERETNLIEKALDIFQHSARGPTPLPTSNFPSRNEQYIPPYALWWICMLHDYMMWRGGADFLPRLMPMAWRVVEYFLNSRSEEGLVRSPEGWNFVDWGVFDGGTPPGGQAGEVSGLINWQLVHALESLTDLSEWLGDEDGACQARSIGSDLCAVCESVLWNQKRQAFADDPQHNSFSEHSQCLAILSRGLSGRRREDAHHALMSDPDLLRTSIYFSHYLCMAFHRTGEGHRLYEKLMEWKYYVDRGFHTFPETDEYGRSECHAWSAHPLFHMLHSVLGIRPGSPGFSSVMVEPQSGPLARVRGLIPHPLGHIEVVLKAGKKKCIAEIALPEGVPGELRWQGRTFGLRENRQTIDLLTG